ncbi:MAG: LPS biosynthesis RfbU related protein [Candidatus Fermentimicrarchaeum limneticum]|uniref:LPS biosynthesis RfbU related protein n=1 Tax=Fermentimicrarchaeum limneticum TaxID=2795018 RepID=A0A7D5XB87_FERL1|nr:MAG: LPS biosynthesis RfbU related protein [Candidatus Fermentimicrarchaeum limneticum]
MRIVFVYDAVYPYTKGGVEKRVYELSKELDSRGHEVHVFCLKFWEGGQVTEREGVYLHGICDPAPLYTKEGRRSILGSIKFAVMLLPTLLKEKRFDVIDCQNFPYFPVLSCRFISAVKGSKLFITWHEFWGDYWHEYLGWPIGVFGKMVERLALSLSPRIISVSEFTKMKLKTNKRVYVIPNGLDYGSLEKAKPLKKRFDVIFVGRLIREKNVDMLLRAIALLKSRYPRIRCCIIGEGPERQRIIELASSLGVERNVEFHKFLKTHEQVFSYLKSSQVLVLPSSREGFGMIVLEANACGVPVVTVEAEGNAAKEFVRDGVNGKVVPLSPETLANGIEESFSMKVKPIKEYNWKNIAKKLGRVYNA